MMKWFGKSWGAPMCEPETHIDTPVGAYCARCSEIILDDDEGVTIPEMPSGIERPYHLNCSLRMTIGSVGHILRRCSCYVKEGKTFEDPPKLTPRQAADAAVRAHAIMRRVVHDFLGEEL